MKIFFSGQIIPQQILNEQPQLSKLVDAAGNNFYNHLLNGFAANGCDVTACLRTDQDMAETYGKVYESASVKYLHSRLYKNVFAKYLNVFFGTMKNIFKWKKNTGKNEEKFIVVNCLRMVQCIATIIIGLFIKVPIVAVVTDVPGHRGFSSNSFVRKFNDKLGQFLMGFYDAYILLSKDMNPLVNKKKKPYIVVEGLINPDVFGDEQPQKHDKFTIMYAGSLMRKYNIMGLVDAVRMMESQDLRLVIYGSGEVEDELKALSKEDNRIEYKGRLPYREILTEEQKAHLLVNPRSTQEEYTKLSFPSKNIEYMLSGTPVLYTKLESMPEEYYDYINLIDDESAEGICKKLTEIMSADYNELLEKADKAKNFVKDNKNFISQSKKIIDMLRINEII